MKKKPLYCIIILFIISLTVVIKTGNTSAIIPNITRNIYSLTYNENNTTSTPITVNSINSSGSTPVITKTLGQGENTYNILRPYFNLNQTVKLSKDIKFLLTIEINASTTSVYMNGDERNIYFLCPQGNYEKNLYISDCSIRESYEQDYRWTNSGTNNGAAYDETGQALISGKTYIIDIIFYSSKDEATDYASLETRGKFLSFSKTNNLPMTATWQINYVRSTSFTEEPNPAAEEIKKQNEKDEQDRSNMNNQQGDIDDNADESTEDMDNATSNITGIVSTFLGNLNNLNRNNCTLPNISAYGFSLGELNLCTFQPPQWVRTVTSAVVSLIVLSMAVHVFRRIMRIAKGIAGSK